jgi:uncharacterized protein (DUF952 family)
MSLVYKILPRAEWEQALGVGRFEGSAIVLKDGYIHLSTAAQVRATARLHFKGQPDLALVAVSAEALGAALKWELSRGGDLFPHLHGPLDTALAVEVWLLDLDADGVPLIGDLEPRA